MYCSKCGSFCENTAKFCNRCGAALAPPGSPPPYDPTNPRLDPDRIGSQCQIFFVLSIVATILCCRAFGIVSIVYACKARRLLREQDIPGAYKALGNAKVWTWLSIALGLFYLFVQFSQFLAAYR